MTFPFLAPNVYKDAMKRSLRSLAESLQAQLVGDGAVESQRNREHPSGDAGRPGFVEDEKYLRLGA